MKNSIIHSAVGLSATLALVAVSAPSAFAGGGDINWEEQYDLAGGTDELTDIDLRGQKILVVGGVGPSTPGGVNDTWIVRAYDSKDNGSIEWEDSFVNPDGEVTLGGVSASGNRVFVAGSRETAGGNHRLILKVYDARKGTVFWEDEVDIGPDDGRAAAVHLKGKSGWVVGSRTSAGTGKTSWWIRAYDAKTSALKWEDIPVGETDDPRGATHVYLQGSTLIVGGIAEDGGGDTDWRLRGYKTKDASLLWEDQYDSGEGDDEIAGLKGMGKRFVIGGTAAKAGGGSLMRITAVTTKEGEFIWEDFVDEGTDNAAVAVVGHGPCVFMGGEVDGDFFIRGYATFTGANMWTDRVPDGAANAMTSYGSKTVFAAGRLDDGLGEGDIFIKNYSFHTGVVVWEDTRDIDGDDEITLLVAKGNNVFTVGEVDKSGPDQDWLVTNYDRQ